MKTRTKILIGLSVLVIVVLLAIDVYHMGICIVHSGGFDWAQGYIFSDVFPDYDHYISITNGQPRGFVIPYVIQVGLLSNPPYDIHFLIKDKTQTITEIVIDSVVVKYKDGTETEAELDWKKDFKSWPILTYDEGELLEIPANGVEVQLDAIVKKNQSCTIKLNGYFVSNKGEKTHFNTSNYFEYEPSSWDVYTYLSSF